MSHDALTGPIYELLVALEEDESGALSAYIHDDLYNALIAAERELAKKYAP
jgi:hypothetical protein